MVGILWSLLAVLVVLALPVAALAVAIRARGLAGRVARLEERLARLEDRLVGAAAADGAPEATPGMGSPPVPQRPDVGAPAAALSPAGSPREPATGTGTAGLEAFETAVGTRWLNRIAAAALILGTAFFLKYAFDNRWITETARTVLGGAGGLGFVWAGDRARRRGYLPLAQSLAGAGIAILYLSVWAALHLYALLGPWLAAACMAGATALAVGVALGWGSLPVALLGLAGGFATPFLIGGDLDVPARLFLYVAALDLGLLAVADARRWPALAWCSLAGTTLVFGAWLGEYDEPGRAALALGFATAFGLLFVGFALWQVAGRRGPASPGLVALVTAAGILYAAAVHAVLAPHGEPWRGAWMLGAAVAAGAAAVPWLRGRADARDLGRAFAGLAAAYGLLAASRLFDGWTVTAAWSAEATALVWLGLRARDASVRAFGATALGLALSRFLLADLRAAAPAALFVPLWNPRVWAAAAAVAACSAIATLLRRHADRLRPEERWLAPSALGAALALVWIAGSHEIAGAVARGAARSGRPGDPNVRNWTQLGLSAYWAAYGGACMAVGVLRRSPALRLGALALLGLTVAKVFLFDVAVLGRGYRIASFLVLGAILLAASYLYDRYRDRIRRFALGK